jgi:cytochrome P450
MSASQQFISKVTQKRIHLLSVPLGLEIYPYYRRHRSAGIVYDDARGAWLVLRYDDVQRVLLDVGEFSSVRTYDAAGKPDEVLGLGMLSADPPRHRFLRHLVSQAFTTKRIAQLEPRIREIAATLLDDMAAHDSVDLVEAFSFPFPIRVIAELLGVPATQALQFRQWAADIVGNVFEARVTATRALAAYFGQLIVQRETSPGVDLISEMLAAELNGDHMTRTEVIATCLLLLIAGHETTATLIGNAMWCFDEHPDAWETLIANPGMLPLAIEEVLRYRSVVHFLPRVVRRDTEFLGHELEAGDMVLPMFAAANLDSERFAEPDRFDIARTPNRHIGFGHGIHLCLGATLARLEARIGLGALMERFPRIRRDAAQPLALRPSSMVYSLAKYPVQLGR